jgi:membrane-associated protease RseP (regulator of RpoE activity)
LKIASPTDFGDDFTQYKQIIESSLTVASVIAIHELGHFGAARLQNIKVTSFNIGYGPKIISTGDKYDTEFNLRSLPLGGYVAFPPDQLIDDVTGEVIGDIDDPDLLQRRSPWQRALVISGGVIANILLTFFLSASTSYVSGIGHPTFSPGIVITQAPGADTAGYAAGLQNKDVILQVNDKVLPASDFATEEFVREARSNANKPMNMIVKRSDKLITLKGSPNEKGVLGIRVNNVIESVKVEKSSNIFEAIKIGVDETGRLLYITGSSFARAIPGGLTGNEIGGPIAVVKTGADLAGVSNLALVGFAATLSINLALINSLPFPALDGGQLLFVIVEIITGKPVNRSLKDTVTALAFSLLLYLGLTSFVGDFVRINNSVQPIPTAIQKNIP